MSSQTAIFIIYILPINYGLNNMFLLNWSEEDYSNLEFYDIFDKLYTEVYHKSLTYMA
ncbi:MAG: DUF6070 family protein, partial [Christensenellaceae bacterium]